MSVQTIAFGKHEGSKKLGLQWPCNVNSLIYKISQLKLANSITKRRILYEIAQIFDPLGLLAHCVLIAQILFQQLWLLKLTWHESVPQESSFNWKTFRAQLPNLNGIRIPRYVILENPYSIEFHGFADASQDGHGACLYLRSVSLHNQSVDVHLHIAKSRVVPVKLLTIPRLELCAATLRNQLTTKVTESLTINIDYNDVVFLKRQIILYLPYITIRGDIPELRRGEKEVHTN